MSSKPGNFYFYNKQYIVIKDILQEPQKIRYLRNYFSEKYEY